jgi:hypothetical protein
MSAPDIDYLLDLWAFSAAKHNDTGPFASTEHMYASIDATKVGDAPWKCLEVGYTGELTDNSPPWHAKQWHVWYRDPDTVIANMLANPDFDGEFDYSAYVEMRRSGRRWSDFMSGNAAWLHSVSSFYYHTADVDLLTTLNPGHHLF